MSGRKGVKDLECVDASKQRGSSVKFAEYDAQLANQRKATSSPMSHALFTSSWTSLLTVIAIILMITQFGMSWLSIDFPSFPTPTPSHHI